MTSIFAQNSFRIVPVKSEFLQHARNAGLDDQRQPVETSVARGGEPCRDVLRRARAGEEIILTSYCPFDVSGPYKEYGPIFILGARSEEAVDLGRLPIGAESDYLNQTFVLRAYSKDERIVDGILSAPDQAEENLQRIFSCEEVDFVLARFAGYGCYACRIERR